MCLVGERKQGQITTAQSKKWYVMRGGTIKCSSSWKKPGSPSGWRNKEGIIEEVTAKLSLEGRIELRHTVVRTLFLELAINTYWDWTANDDSSFSSSS